MKASNCVSTFFLPLLYKAALRSSDGKSATRIQRNSYKGNPMLRQEEEGKVISKTIIMPGLILVLILAAVGTASAISNGVPDEGRHPYVAFIGDPVEWRACSAVAISPTVLVTAAHCVDSHNVLVSFSAAPSLSSGVWFIGTPYPDPEFCLECGNGLPGFDSHDVAVVVLSSPVTLPRYANLPSEGQVDTLANKTAIDLVGYGVQFDTGGGPKIPYDGAFSKFYAPSQLVASNNVHSEEYIKLTANPGQGKGGVCFGDSGGPDLLEGTDTILAVNSYVLNDNCVGVTYSNRIDTYALEFIESFLW